MDNVFQNHITVTSIFHHLNITRGYHFMKADRKINGITKSYFDDKLEEIGSGIYNYEAYNKFEKEGDTLGMKFMRLRGYQSQPSYGSSSYTSFSYFDLPIVALRYHEVRITINSDYSYVRDNVRKYDGSSQYSHGGDIVKRHDETFHYVSGNYMSEIKSKKKKTRKFTNIPKKSFADVKRKQPIPRMSFGRKN